MTENEALKILKISPEMKKQIPNLAEVYEIAVKAIEENQQYREIGTVEELKVVNKLCESLEEACKTADALVEELKKYSEIGTVDECRVAMERMKEMSLNDSMVTVGLYFEVHDADIYGGKGTVGYASTNVDLKVSALAKADMDNYVQAQRKGVADMCKVDIEKVIIISRTDYEEETADEDDCDWN